MKYDMAPIKYREPTFLDLAKNHRSYVCPVCGSGNGRNGSGMTSRNGEYWKCWSCSQSYSKVELFRIQNSLSYEEACVGLLRYYGIVPTPIGTNMKQSSVWLSRDEMEALGFYPGRMQVENQDGTQVVYSLTSLFSEDPETYYAIVIARVDEMIRKYKKVYADYGNRNSPKASLVYDYLGEAFDDSSYQKIRKELDRRTSICEKIKNMYTKRLKGLSGNSKF